MREEQEKKKKRKTPWHRKSKVETEIYDNNKNCDWGEKKKLKSLFRIFSANKINYCNRGQKRKKKK